MLQLVFSEGQNTSTGCVSVLILEDTEEEGDEYFTLSITSAGTQPHAKIISPSVVTIIIQEDNPTDDEDLVLSLPILATILSVASVVLGVISCIAAVLVYHCLSKYGCCKKTQAHKYYEDPVYAAIKEGGKTPNKVRITPPDSLSPPTAAFNKMEMIPTSPNESYTSPIDSGVHTRPVCLGIHQEGITTSLNEAYTFATLAAVTPPTTEPG